MASESQHGSIQNLLAQSLSSLQSDQQQLLLANYNLPGLRVDGRMSTVRRFFCLFVTFDLLFTALFWIICVLINGESIKDGLSKEVVHYSFQTSMFDIVVCSVLRFLALLLFYAVVHIQHWWLVAVTTLLSSAFLVSKSLLYKWGSGGDGVTMPYNSVNSNSSSYPFQVLLVLLEFLIAWTEAWFIDFSVLPQETRAINLVRALNSGGCGVGRGVGVGRVHDFLGQCNAVESVANFYSPLQSPYESEDEDQDGKNTKLNVQESSWQCLAVEGVLRALELLRAPSWQPLSSLSCGASITWRLNSSGHRIYHLTGVVAAPAELLYRDAVEQFTSMPSWNPCISSASIVQRVSHNVDVVHHVAADVPGGLIKSRDFVLARHWRRVEGGGSGSGEWAGVCWLAGGLSVQHPQVPVTKQHIRGENGPGCWAFCEPANSSNASYCTFHWLLDTDLKGWLPRAVVEAAIAGVMADQLTALRQRAKQLLVLQQEDCVRPVQCGRAATGAAVYSGSGTEGGSYYPHSGGCGGFYKNDYSVTSSIVTGEEGSSVSADQTAGVSRGVASLADTTNSNRFSYGSEQEQTEDQKDGSASAISSCTTLTVNEPDRGFHPLPHMNTNNGNKFKDCVDDVPLII